MPAILSREESRVDFGIAKDTLIVSPSLAPASSNSSFGIITAMEFPTLLIFPVNTRDMALLLRNNYISMALRNTVLSNHASARGLNFHLLPRPRLTQAPTITQTGPESRIDSLNPDPKVTTFLTQMPPWPA